MTPLDIYLNDIGRYPLLDREQEEALGIRIQSGDREAVDEMVNANLRFVVYLAKPYQSLGHDLLDLIQAGNEGLIRAAEKFDPSYGVKFAQYAAYWIRQALQKYRDENPGAVGPTRNESVRMRTVWRQLEETPDLSVKELMAATGFPRPIVERALTFRHDVCSLDEPLSEDGNTTLLEQIGHEPDPLESVEDENRLQLIREALEEVLTERERDMVCRYFGIGCVRPFTAAEIGEMHGVTSERVRQITRASLKRLKKAKLLEAA